MGSITNTSGERRELIGRIRGRHKAPRVTGYSLAIGLGRRGHHRDSISGTPSGSGLPCT